MENRGGNMECVNDTERRIREEKKRCRVGTGGRWLERGKADDLERCHGGRVG